MTADVVLRTLKHAWVSLVPLGLRMALMGGLSVAVWKHPRATRDVDLLVDPGTSNEDIIRQTLERAGMTARRQPAVLHLGASRIMQLRYEPPGTFLELHVDLLFADSPYQQQALSHRTPARLPGLGIEIAVLSCEDLIVHKLLAGRMLDKADVAALLRGNRTTLDFGYLQEWIGRLDLKTEWSESWHEAFPGEELPGRS
jgi:Nucleotidyl transferase AbiEii toxin, Type IV TA system